MVNEPSDTAIKVRVLTWQKLNEKKLPGNTFDDVINVLLKFYETTKKVE